MPEQEYRIYSSIDPIAHAGDTVTIDVSQTLTPKGGSAALLHTSGPTVEVQIQGPQVQLSEADIAGVYPAAASTTSPDNYLPHIALSRRTLPWERVGPGTGAPWLAVLLLTDADMRIVESPLLMQVEAVTTTAAIKSVGPQQPPVMQQYIQGSLTPQAIQVQSLQPAGQDPNTYKQLIKIPGITAGTTINTLAIPAATLKMLLPEKPADLALLCNAKEVIAPGTNGNTGMYTAIVVGNRLPDAGDGSTPAALHTAALVSLEQRDDIWTRFGNNEFINVVVLHSWTFTPSKGGDFEEVCQMIRYGPNGGVQRFGNLPQELIAPATSPLPGGFVSALDADGYLIQPLQHAEAGNVVWRGPLRPFPPPQRSPGVAIRSAPEQWTNEPAGTKLDYSHATAFELGKLLAIANAGIREDLRELHEVFSLPDKYFVPEASLPAALQRPYWGIDQGQSVDTAESQLNTALENPWQMGSQAMIGMPGAQGKGDFTGVSAIAEANGWVNSVTAELNLAASQAAGQPAAGGLIDTTAAEATLSASLIEQFPELVNATS